MLILAAVSLDASKWQVHGKGSEALAANVATPWITPHTIA